MKPREQPIPASPLLDLAGIRAYASYFAIWLIPLLLLGRLFGPLVDGEGPAQATVYSLMVLIAVHRLLDRFFQGQRRIVQFRERHRLAMHCATVSAVATLMTSLLAARIGLASVGGETPRAAGQEILMFAGLPLVWALDYVLFRLLFSEVVAIPLFALWRRRHGG